MKGGISERDIRIKEGGVEKEGQRKRGGLKGRRERDKKGRRAVGRKREGIEGSK